MRSYSDAQLTAAMEASHSWRGVLRALGLLATSASAMRSVRGHADRLGLDYSHFTGRRRWTDQQLAAAIRSSATWAQACETLGVSGGSSTSTVRGHALRLGLDTRHLSTEKHPDLPHLDMRPRTTNLSRAGSLLAAAWFELCGHEVSWPLEPCRYDLLVWRGGAAERIQVKTTTMRAGSSWVVRLSRTRKEVRTYDPDEIDQFFVIDGDYHQYLIPIRVVGGLTAIQLSAYRAYRLPSLLTLDAEGPNGAG